MTTLRKMNWKKSSAAETLSKVPTYNYVFCFNQLPSDPVITLPARTDEFT